MPTKNHMMIDLETIDTSASSVILSLGAVVFDNTRVLREREWVFDIDSQLKLGRTVTGNTIEWWMKQSDTARSVFTNTAIPKVTPQEFANQFTEFIGGETLKLWGNGADFDLSILIDFWHKTINSGFPSPAPWKFGNHLCFRTFNKITNCKKLVQRTGTHHNALDDAKYQTECVLAAFRTYSWSNI